MTAEEVFGSAGALVAGLVDTFGALEVEEWQQSPLASAAINAAIRGDRVFPLAVREKYPHGRHAPNGFYNGTDDVDQVVEWWSSSPQANIGCRVPDDVVVVDVDPRNGGDVTWREVTAGRPLPPGRVTVSGRGDGGAHYWFADPGGELVAKVGPGVDVLKRGVGYLVLPPSIHPDTGKPYTTPSAAALPAVMPDWLVTALRPAAPAPQAPQRAERTTSESEDDDGPNVLDAVNVLPWSAIWPQGWTLKSSRVEDHDLFPGEVVERWLRPGSTSTHSVVCGTDWCHVFSTSVDGLPDGSYTKAQVYAWRLGITVPELARELWQAGRSHRAC